jgi:uncharacterized membrane protein YeaQ/YmgE (transglycosylase-associated protein family)
VTKTKASHLVVLGVIGAAIGWFIATGAVALGQVIHPPFTLAAALSVMGIAVVFAARPVWRVVRRVDGARVDPFYATRVVLFAKAASLSGALAAGLTGAVLAFELTRSVVPALSSLAMIIVTVIGAVILLVGGIVAERMCTLPPDNDKPDQTRMGRA